MYAEPDRTELLKVARDTIKSGTVGKKYNINVTNYTPALQEFRASFVTLKIDGQLKGCIGSLQAHRPLVLDVCENAYAAAFDDSRFEPVNPDDLEALSIQISVLSSPEEMQFANEQELLSQLRPGEDGLILEVDRHRATFLPSVWESLPEPREFLGHLKVKAGLDRFFWSDDLRVQRYRTESFSDSELL